MSDQRTTQITEIVEARVWGTRTLAAWALNWHQRDGLRHVWELISSSQEEARDCYVRWFEQESDAYVRWCAAEVLVDGGWNLQSINARKS
jgi:hypothetical protein